jgi:hypothetical protein
MILVFASDHVLAAFSTKSVDFMSHFCHACIVSVHLKDLVLSDATEAILHSLTGPVSTDRLHVPSFAKMWHSLHTISMFGFEMRHDRLTIGGPWSYNAEVQEEQSKGRLISLIPFHISWKISAQNYICCVSSAVKIRSFRSGASFLVDIPVKVSRIIGGTCRLLLQDGGVSQTR